MIVGLGIDVVAVARVARAIERWGERFVDRVLTPRERDDLPPERDDLPPERDDLPPERDDLGGRARDHAGRPADRAAAVAGRFAAKEAFAKALGAPRDVGWQDVAIRRGPRGAPALELGAAAARHAAQLGVARSHISITHDAGIAAAVVVLETT